MKKLIITLSLFFAISTAYTQVGGLSASKLGTLCTETVPLQTIEFEPFFGFASSSYAFNSKGETYSLFSTTDSTQFFSSTGFRFSYGLFENLEVGISLPVDVSTLSIGAKYKLPINGKMTFGLLAGYNGIVGNEVYVKRNTVHELTSSVVGGIIMTYDFTERLSLDFNAQYQKHLNKTIARHDQGIYLSSDLGYYLIKNVNFITGINYFFKNNDIFEQNSYLFTLNPGIAIEKAENFILVLNSPIDLFGKNEFKTVGFGLALTIILN